MLDDLVSRAEIVHELDAVETERALRADADLVMDTSLPVERKVPSLERLMAGLSANAWRFVAGEIGATDLALSRQALFPRWHRVLRSTDTVAHHDLEALCCAVSAEPPAPPMPVQMALAICALIPRVDEPALAVAGEIGCWLSEHPDDAVVSALLDVAYAIDPTLGDLVWLDFDFLPDPLAARAQGLGEGRAFGPRLNELLKLALDGQVERLTSHSTPDRRRRILELLRDLGLPEHIPVLAPLARWWLRPSDEKTLAREAIAAIKDRFRHRAGGLSLAAPAKGGLSVPAPGTPPQRPAGARGLRAKALRAQSAEAKSRISRP